MTSFKIGQRVIGPDAPPFVIAEMSGNHNQSLEVALQIVDAAAKAGAHALKLQTYTADTMTLDLAEGEFFIKDPGSLWAGSSLYELYEKAHTPWEWHAPIFARAKALGMLAFSTPFDETAVDFLESLDVPAYKIASFENTDLPLIRRVAATGKPLIISTGMASVAELDETVRAARADRKSVVSGLAAQQPYPHHCPSAAVVRLPGRVVRSLHGCGGRGGSGGLGCDRGGETFHPGSCCRWC